MDERDIQHRLTFPYFSRKNVLDERMNGTQLHHSCSMSLSSNVSRSFWDEALSAAVHIQNEILVAHSHRIHLLITVVFEFLQLFRIFKYLEQSAAMLFLRR